MKMLLVPEASFCQHVNRQLASGKGHQEAKALSCSSSAWTDFFFFEFLRLRVERLYIIRLSFPKHPRNLYYQFVWYDDEHTIKLTWARDLAHGISLIFTWQVCAGPDPNWDVLQIFRWVFRWHTYLPERNREVLRKESMTGLTGWRAATKSHVFSVDMNGWTVLKARLQKELVFTARQYIASYAIS